MEHRDDAARPRPPSLPDVNAAGSELRDLVLDSPGITDFLRDLASIAAGLVADGRAGITLHRDGEALTTAWDDDVIARLDEVQHVHGDGPVLEAIRTCRRVDMPALAEESRWGEFGSHALVFGMASGVCLPLVVEGDPLGALAVYARTAGAFTEDVVPRLQAIADEAVAGLVLALRRHESLVDSELVEALATRRVVDQALGMLMHARGVDSEQALALLLEQAATEQRALGELAAEIVAAGGPGDAS